MLRRMTGNIAQMLLFTRNGLPSARQGEDIKVAQLRDQSQSLLGGESSISFDDYLSSPDRRLELLQHFSRQKVLMPADLGIEHAHRQGDAKASPLGNQQQHAVTKDVRLELS